MLAGFWDSAVFYVVQTLVLGLLGILFYRGSWKRLKGPTAYLIALFLIDGVGRRYVLAQFGLNSAEYYYFFFISDAVLALGAFLVLSVFFRQVCASDPRMWHFVRFFLTVVFLLVVGISTLTLTRHFSNLFGYFMIEFEQNLYFTCLVLNSLLYILVARNQPEDEEMGLLVTGMGLQFAGPAAVYALKFLTPGVQLTAALVHYLNPICTLGMLMTWLYVLALRPKRVRVPAPGDLATSLVAGQDSHRLRSI